MKRLKLLPLVFVLSFMMSGCGMMMMNSQQDDDEFDQQQTINDTMDQQNGNGNDGS